MAIQYFHMSRRKLESGSALNNPGNNLTDTVIESILENNRPPAFISRSNATFVSTSTDFSKHGLPYDEGYIHEVSVSGQTSTHDNAWIGELQLRHTKSESLKSLVKPLEEAKCLSDNDIAAEYWKGTESSNVNWEILALGVKVIECVSTEPVRLAHTNPESMQGNIADILRDSREE